jgi:hypothetical protein
MVGRLSETASARTLGPFLCLRNRAGRGVQRTNEGNPVRWQLAS